MLKCNMFRSRSVLYQSVMSDRSTPSLPSLPSLSHSYETLNGSDTLDIQTRIPLRPAPPGNRIGIALMIIWYKKGAVVPVSVQDTGRVGQSVCTLYIQEYSYVLHMQITVTVIVSTKNRFNLVSRNMPFCSGNLGNRNGKA